VLDGRRRSMVLGILREVREGKEGEEIWKAF